MVLLWKWFQWFGLLFLHFQFWFPQSNYALAASFFFTPPPPPPSSLLPFPLTSAMHLHQRLDNNKSLYLSQKDNSAKAYAGFCCMMKWQGVIVKPWSSRLAGTRQNSSDIRGLEQLRISILTRNKNWLN